MNLLGQRRSQKYEPVEIQEKRFGYFPKAFRWHGKRYDVQAIERCWSRTFAMTGESSQAHQARRYKFVTTGMRRAPHLCFRVRCREGLFELYQNVLDNTWRLVSLGLM